MRGKFFRTQRVNIKRQSAHHWILRKKFLGLFAFLLLIFALPVVLIFSRQKTQLQQNAASCIGTYCSGNCVPWSICNANGLNCQASTDCAQHNAGCNGTVQQCAPPPPPPGCPSGQTSPHNVCTGTYCSSVSGCGSNNCSPAGSSCGINPPATCPNGHKPGDQYTQCGGTCNGVNANSQQVVHVTITSSCGYQCSQPAYVAGQCGYNPQPNNGPAGQPCGGQNSGATCMYTKINQYCGQGGVCGSLYCCNPGQNAPAGGGACSGLLQNSNCGLSGGSGLFCGSNPACGMSGDPHILYRCTQTSGGITTSIQQNCSPNYCVPATGAGNPDYCGSSSSFPVGGYSCKSNSCSPNPNCQVNKDPNCYSDSQCGGNCPSNGSGGGGGGLSNAQCASLRNGVQCVSSSDSSCKAGTGIDYGACAANGQDCCLSIGCPPLNGLGIFSADGCGSSPSVCTSNGFTSNGANPYCTAHYGSGGVCCVRKTSSNSITTATVQYAPVNGNSNPVITISNFIMLAALHSPVGASALLAEGKSNVLGAQVISITGTAIYNPATGNYESQGFGFGGVPDGDYDLILHVDGFLNKKLVPANGAAAFTITAGQSISIAPVSLTPGDVEPLPHGDNYVDIQDYNAVLNCMKNNPVCTPQQRQIADLTKDGVVDQKDLDLIQKSFGMIGDSFGPPTFNCVTDPACQGSGSRTLQMCQLKCTIKPVF